MMKQQMKKANILIIDTFQYLNTDLLSINEIYFKFLKQLSGKLETAEFYKKKTMSYDSR
jgi:hypothetical protein